MQANFHAFLSSTIFGIDSNCDNEDSSLALVRLTTMLATSQARDDDGEETPRRENVAPRSKMSDIQRATKNLVTATTAGSDNADDWIAFRLNSVHAQKMGYGGLGKFLNDNLGGDIGDDRAVKSFLSSEAKLMRGPHSQGVYRWAQKGSDGKEGLAVYKSRDEPSNAPYVKIRWRNPDNDADDIHMREWLGHVPTKFQKKPNQFDHLTWEESVRAQLRNIHAKGDPLHTPTRPPPIKKSNPAKRKQPLTDKDNSPYVARLEAASNLLLVDPEAANNLINVGEFLTTHVNMNDILNTKNHSLTPKSKAAKQTVRSGQVLSALKKFKDQYEATGSHSPSLVTPEKPAEPSRETRIGSVYSL